MGNVSVRDIYADKVLVAQTINQVELKSYIDRAVGGQASSQDLEAIDRELITGGIRDSSISIVADTINTVRNVTEIYSAADAPSVLALLEQREKLIEADRARSEQKAYFAAVNNLAARSPYRFKQASQNLGETFVPLLFSTVGNALDSNGHAENDGLNLADALRGHACVALIARAGAGKSTLLRHLALNAWANPASIGLERPHLPMLVKLRHLATAAGATTEERLWRAIEAARDIAIGGAPIVAGFMWNWQEQLAAPWLLLLDGLDEVPSALREDLLDWTQAAIDGLPNCRLVIASRAEGIFDGSSIGYAARRIYIEALSAELRQTLLARLTDPGAAKSIEQAIESGSNQDIVDTPLNATIAALVYRKTGALPRNRTLLYETFVDLMIGEAERQGIDQDLPASARKLSRRLLELMALATTEDDANRERPILVKQVADWLSELRPGTPRVDVEHDAHAAVDVLISRSGLTIPGADAEWTHATIREFLAASAIAREASPSDPRSLAVIDRWADLRWRNVVIFLVGQWAREPRSSAQGKAAAEGVELVLKRLLGIRDALPAKPAGLLARLGFGRAARSSIPPSLPRENVLIAAEALSEAEGASSTVVKLIFDGLFASDNITTYKTCEGLFTSDRRDLEVLLRFRSWPRIEQVITPYLAPIARQLMESGGGSRAYGAVMLLVRLGAAAAFKSLMLDNVLSVEARLSALERVARLEDPVLAVAVAEELRTKGLKRDVQINVEAVKAFETSLTTGTFNLETLLTSSQTEARVEEWGGLVDVYRSADAHDRLRDIALRGEDVLRPRALRVLSAEVLVAIAIAQEVEPEQYLTAARYHRSSGTADGDETLAACLRAALKAEPRSVAHLLEFGELEKGAGHFEEATRIANQALTIEPQNAEALYLRSSANYRQDRDGEALLDCEAAIQADAANTHYAYFRGALLESLGRDREAIDAFSHAISLGSTDDYCWTLRALRYEWLGYPAEALADLDDVEVPGYDQYARGVAGRVRVRSLCALGRTAEALQVVEEMQEDALEIEGIDWYRVLAELTENGVVAARSLANSAFENDTLNRKLFLHLFAKIDRSMIEEQDTFTKDEIDSMGDYDKVWYGALSDQTFVDLNTLPDYNLRKLRFDAPYLRLAIGEQAATSFEQDCTAALKFVGDLPPPIRIGRPVEDEMTEAEQPLPDPPAVRLPPARYILCKLRAIADFENEKDRATRFLEAYGGKPTIIGWTLEDGEHVYLQANYRQESDDPFPFKTVVRFVDMVEHGLLQRFFRESSKPVQFVVVDDALASRLSATTSMKSVVKSMRRMAT